MEKDDLISRRATAKLLTEIAKKITETCRNRSLSYTLHSYYEGRRDGIYEAINIIESMPDAGGGG